MKEIIDSDSCPHCEGAGQIILKGQPHFCYPCEGTGLAVFDLEDTGPPGREPCTPSN